MIKIIECLLCGSKKLEKFYDGTDKYYSQKNISLSACCNCGLIFLNPRLADREYKDWYKSVFQDKRRGLTSVKQVVDDIVKKKKYEHKLKEMIYFEGLADKNSRCLEIGCGWGTLAKAVKDRFGCKINTVEPSELAAKVAREYFGLNAHSGDFNSFIDKKSGNDKYDLIYSYHVFEHIAEPGVFLEKIKKILRGNGKLFLALPNTLKPDRVSEQYFHIDHCFFYTPRTIELMLNKHGFKVIKQWPHKTDIRIVCSPSNTINFKLITDRGETKKIKGIIKRVDRKYLILRGIKKMVFIFFSKRQKEWINKRILFLKGKIN